MPHTRKNVSQNTFQEYVKEKIHFWELTGKDYSSSNVIFLKYPYLTSVNNAIIRGEAVPRKNKIKAFDLKYQRQLV